MKKLDFLIGKWSGEARVQRRLEEVLELIQTEDAQYKLDGLVLLVEGTGELVRWQNGVPRSRDSFVRRGAEVYRMRANSDGRYLETELKLADNGLRIHLGLQVRANQNQRDAHKRRGRVDGNRRSDDGNAAAQEVCRTGGPAPEVTAGDPSGPE